MKNVKSKHGYFKKTILKNVISGFFFVFLISCSATDSATVFDDRLQTEKVERFEVLVETSNPNVVGSIQRLESDKGLIMLPMGYSSNGKPTKLIIYCHSGSGTVTDTQSESETDNYCKYFVSLGYAVLDMAAMPKDLSDRLVIDCGRTVGSFVAVRSYVEGYNFVMKKYNLDPNGCYMFSNSNGGLVSLNLGNLTTIPIIAQAGMCPLLSIELNAWNIRNASLGSGFTSYQIRANIVRIYGMQDIKSQIELNNAVYDKEKVKNYDPYDYILNHMDKAYKIPYKIFQPKNDPIVNYLLAEKLVQVTNSRGGNMILRPFETGGHTAEPINEIVGEYSFKGKTYPITPTIVEVVNYFKSFGGTY